MEINLISGFWPLASGAVGERSARQGSPFVRRSGGGGSENAGMSSVNPGENPGHRKPKVSYGRSIRVGLVGPKPRPKGVGDGQEVSIPPPPLDRYEQRGDPER